MVKIYVIDTNILIQNPQALLSFEDNQVILPVVVLEELDNLKKADGEKGRNARTAIRILEELRQKGDLLEGIELASGGILRVEKNFVNVQLPEDLPEEKMDNRILKVCKGLAESCEEQVVLVTKDILLRIKAQIIGIRAEDYTTEQVVEYEGQYRGRIEVYVPEEKFKEFKKRVFRWRMSTFRTNRETGIVPKLEENEFVILKADQSAKKTQLGRVEKGVN